MRQLSRRQFLGLSIPAMSLFVLGRVPISKPNVVQTSPTQSGKTAAKAILVDISKCKGCRACETVCRKLYKLLPESKPLDLSPRSLTVVKSTQIEGNGEVKWLYSKWQCMHCVQPTCTTVCPVGALYKTSDGPVLYDKAKCIGCECCVNACPFHIPRFNWGEDRTVKMCNLCAERIGNGLEPACVEICKHGVLTFGERQSIIAQATEAAAKGAYVYGRDELGGTSWIYVSEVPFHKLGFPDVGTVSYPEHSRGIWFSQIASMGVGVALIWGLSWYLKRRGNQEARNNQ